MTEQPDKRGEWFKAVQGLQGQARENKDEPTVALLEAVAKLLMGDPVASLDPKLEGRQAECWARIVEGVSKGEQDT